MMLVLEDTGTTGRLAVKVSRGYDLDLHGVSNRICAFVDISIPGNWFSQVKM